MPLRARTPAEIGEWFRWRRLAKGLTQSDIPGVSSATVRKIEHGLEPNPRERTQILLARALGLDDRAYEAVAAGESPLPLAVATYAEYEDTALDLAWQQLPAGLHEDYQRALEWIQTLPEDAQEQVHTFGRVRWWVGRRSAVEELRLLDPDAWAHWRDWYFTDPTNAQFAQAAHGGPTESQTGTRDTVNEPVSSFDPGPDAPAPEE
jgi:transcriptional regulator with XRE-family HTH domain